MLDEQAYSRAVSALTVPLLLAGFGLLILGGEALVRGGSGLGRALGLSPLVVGLTIVAFATSAPELAVSVSAALSGAPGLAVGNVVGSNTTNVLLVLGVAALVLPVAVQRSLVRTDVPVMLALSVLLLVLAADGRVGRVEGLILIVALTGYLVRSLQRARAAGGAPEDSPDPRPRPLRQVGQVVLGVGVLVLGARLLVRSATELAQAAGLSDLVIGLTVVAIGTSLPEVATSVISALRGQRDLAVGNIVGSNIFNIGLVMGLTAVVAPAGVPVDPAAVRFDIPVMIAVALLLVPLVFTAMTVNRWEALLLLAYYGTYVGYLLLDATDHDALPVFSRALVSFVVPITVVVLLAVTGSELSARRRRSAVGGAIGGQAAPGAGGRRRDGDDSNGREGTDR